MLTLPVTSGGRQLWLDPAVQDMVDRLHFGDSTLGWEGDESLALYRTPRGWELTRREEDGSESIVCRSGPNTPLDRGLIIRLIQHDARRGHDAEAALASVLDHNDALEESRTNEAVAALVQSRERVDWEVGKALGEHTPFIPISVK